MVVYRHKEVRHGQERQEKEKAQKKKPFTTGDKIALAMLILQFLEWLVGLVLLLFWNKS